jgi:hypothetical protein
MAQSWTHQQVTGKGYSGDGVAVTSVSVTMTSVPTAGNLMCVCVSVTASSFPSVTVTDGNGNVYTAGPHSPETAAIPSMGWFYLYQVPGTITSKTITATFASNAEYWTMLADEFNPSTGYVAVFDQDKAATGTSGTFIQVPSITPAASGELLYGMLSDCYHSSVQTGWVAGGSQAANNGTTYYLQSEYILSSTGSATGVYWAGISTSSPDNVTAVMAFKTAASITANPAGSLCLLGCGNA